MRRVLFSIALLATSLTHAATPIDGLYTDLHGGYAYLPNNLSTNRQGLTRTDANYRDGYNAGGSIGYKSNPLRYEGDITYLNADLKKFKVDRFQQTAVRGQNNVILALANVYYDLPVLVDPLQPYVGVGIGYAWVKAKFQSSGPNVGPTIYNISRSAFSYQATTGILFNFAENYALGIGYRYVATDRINSLGKVFQAHMANLSAIYRFDGNRYK